jgi:hypothetical protein
VATGVDSTVVVTCACVDSVGVVVAVVVASVCSVCVGSACVPSLVGEEDLEVGVLGVDTVGVALGVVGAEEDGVEAPLGEMGTPLGEVGVPLGEVGSCDVSRSWTTRRCNFNNSAL